MKKVILSILGVCFAINEASSMGRSMSPVAEDGRPISPIRPIEEYYKGDPSSEHASLYLYLCRKGCDPTEKKCVCGRCCGNHSGLSLGLICVDESEREFVGIGPDTSNVIWSMYVAFGQGGKKKCCCGPAPGDLNIDYCYVPSVYAQIEALTMGDDVFTSNDFLHKEDGEMCEERGKGVIGGRNELSLTHIIRSSLFRLRFQDIGVTSITRVLGLFGRLGEKRAVNGADMQVLVPYSSGGIGGHNCATFSRAVLGELTYFPVARTYFRPLVLATGFGTAAWAGADIGAPFGPVGMAVGAGVGVAVEGIAIALSTIIKKAKANTPGAVIDMTLDFFQKKYEEADEETRQILDWCFSVVVHDEEKIKSFLNADPRLDPNNYNELELRSISDVISSKVRIKKSKGKIFFKEDFEKKDGGCILL